MGAMRIDQMTARMLVCELRTSCTSAVGSISANTLSCTVHVLWSYRVINHVVSSSCTCIVAEEHVLKIAFACDEHLRVVVIIVCNYKMKSNYNRLIKQFRVVFIIPPKNTSSLDQLAQGYQRAKANYCKKKINK